ncbi:nitrate- and nitrite sensing domain-containing protein [Streptosporangium sp. NBC_01755]|uniref:sensor histidine kinase n=1 Tax=Streptosporangium sp. NBC_01755 TaxID=2975949 RepID=UPI002DD80D95|nr:nitrate- and nitrite sensing domain-containing protein [Streptosporangium sp. NBC_01755]WSC98123.1 nitrate- and nitrite sensing domain-containing protein [Streptosporangium sp. NBC_01755]
MRPRLVALILLPTAAAILLTGLQLTTALSTAGEYRRMTEVASLVESLGTLSHEMAEERDLTAWYVAGANRTRLTKVREQRGVVDRSSKQTLAAVEALDESQAARVRTEVTQIRGWLDGLPGLRRLMTDGSVLPRAALGMYSRMIADFITLHDDLGRSGGDERLIGDALALGALSRAKEQVARQRGTLLVSFLDRKFDFDDPADLLGAYRSQQSEENAFRATASAADVKKFRDVVNGPKIDQADSMRALVMSFIRENKPLERIGTGWLRSADTWYTASSAIVDNMRTVERGLSAAVVARSQEMEAAEQRSAAISGASILVLLVLILLITAWVAGTLVRPLRKLRSEALEVADSRLPETVRALRESGDHAPNIEVPSIGVASRDEIGEVARAFDEVHREAIRLAGDEARLRSNINAMFVNLSRRTQSLVERQIDLIDDLEQGEQDEGRLGSLFKLDHLATRMRRNSENLLVLAGQEQSRRWSEPVPLSDVVRASLSEVENYERVNLRVESGISIIGHAVNDIVHLVAELVENAIFFSPQDTKITVTSNGNEMGAVILAVTDAGIGMSDEELAEANRRLAEPPAVDLSVSRRMGLFVVGRLATRHGIRVQLRRPETGGLSAVVLLPAQVVAQGTVMPEMAMAGQGGMPPGFFGDPANSFSSVNPDPFGSVPNLDPFGTGAGPGGRPQAGLGQPAQAPPQPPQVPAPMSGDLWSGPVVPASAVEDLWSSPLTPTPAPSFPSAWSETSSSELWTPQRLEPVENTQALPVVEVSPTEPEPEEFLPIFEAVGSDWFRSSASVAPEQEQGADLDPDPEPVAETRPRPLEPRVRRGPQGLETQNFPKVSDSMPQPQPQPQPIKPVMPAAERQPWSTPSDQGWAAAEAAKKPMEGGVTGSGLPKRVPKANLVPGAASAAPAAQPLSMPPISADRVRSRLSSFQQGVRQGRAEMSERAKAVEGENQQ